MKTIICLKSFVNDYLQKQSFASNSPHTPSDLILFTNFVTLRPFTQFQLKIRTTKLPESAKICFTS